jgi:uncharacterized membrane protein
MDEPDDAERAGGAFRAGLRRELPRWRAEGLVDENVERALTERYRLDEKTTDLATTAVYVLGALLVGGGVISFVAWNWDEIPDAAKLFVIGAAMVTAHVVGWRMWKVTGTWPRVGHALTFVGTLIYGADIGLVAQIYNIHSDWYSGFGLWAFGAAVAAWALSSLPNAALGVVLATVWGVGFTGDHETWIPIAPYLVVALFFPLAWTKGSRALFALVVVGLLVLADKAAEQHMWRMTAVYATDLALVSALVAWPFAFRDGSPGSRFSGVARTLGILGYGVLAYVASFENSSTELAFERIADHGFQWTAVAVPLFVAAPVFIALGWRRAPDPASELRLRAPSLAVLAGVALLLVSMAATRHTAWMTVAGNVALAVPAAIGVATSVRELERGTFWISTLTLGLVVVTRFLEYDTNLGVKAAAFVGSGVAVILVGVAFERRLRAQAGAR